MGVEDGGGEVNETRSGLLRNSIKAKGGDSEKVKDAKLNKKGDVRRSSRQLHDGEVSSGRWASL